MFDVPRSDSDAALAPVPGLAELELLASAHRAADAPESMRLTVYRVVQEALTNVRKHAHGTAVSFQPRSGGTGAASNSWASETWSEFRPGPMSWCSARDLSG